MSNQKLQCERSLKDQAPCLYTFHLVLVTCLKVDGSPYVPRVPGYLKPHTSTEARTGHLQRFVCSGADMQHNFALCGKSMKLGTKLDQTTTNILRHKATERLFSIKIWICKLSLFPSVTWSPVSSQSCLNTLTACKTFQKSRRWPHFQDGHQVLRLKRRL